MPKSRSKLSLHDDRDDRRYVSRSHYDDLGVSEGPHFGRTPPNDRRSSGKAVEIDARRHYDEGDGRPSMRSWTKDGRSPRQDIITIAFILIGEEMFRPVPSPSVHRDQSKWRRSSSERRKLSDTRDQEGQRYNVLPSPDRHSRHRSRSLDQDSPGRERTKHSTAGAYAGGGLTTDTGPAPPDVAARSSKMPGNLASNSARRYSSFTRRSPSGRYSPPRRTSSKVSRVGDTLQIGQRSGTLSPSSPGLHRSPQRRTLLRTPRVGNASRIDQHRVTISPGSRPGDSNFPPRTISKPSGMRDRNESRPARKDSDHGSPLYVGRPQRRTFSEEECDYESRTERRSQTRRVNSPPERSSPLRRSASEALGKRDNLGSRTYGRSGARRFDSMPDRSIPLRQSTSRAFRRRDDYPSRTSYRSGDRSPDSPRNCSTPQRRTSGTPGEHEDLEMSSGRQTGVRGSGGPPERGRYLKSASKSSRWHDDYESPDQSTGAHSPRSPSDPSTRPQKTSTASRIAGYFDRFTARWNGARLWESPTKQSSSRRRSPEASRVNDDLELPTEQRSEPPSPRGPRDYSPSKVPQERENLEPRTIPSSGDPTKGSDATERSPPPGRKQSTSQDQHLKTTGLEDKATAKADASGKSSALSAKQNSGGNDEPQPKAAGSANGGKATTKPKPIDAAAQGPVSEHSMLEESEESDVNKKQKKEKSTTSVEYVPPSEVGKATAAVVESLGPSSNDDDADDQGEDTGEDTSLGWFRLWVLCSVAAIVLMIPFSLTVLSYDATSRFFSGHEGSHFSGKHPNDPGAQEGPADLPSFPTVKGPVTYYDDQSGRSDKCEWQGYDNTEEMKLVDVPKHFSGTAVERGSLRKVFCVYDILKLNGDWLKSYRNFPFEYCTDIVVYSFYVNEDDMRVLPKRRISVAGRPTLPFSQLTHHHTVSNVYLTYGGSRADSAAMAAASGNLHSVVTSITMAMGYYKYTGLNIDWDHPNDGCDSTGGKGLLELLKGFSGERYRLLVTLPPDADIVKEHYSVLWQASLSIEYVVIATHRLRPRGVVSCSSSQHVAATVFSAARKALEPTYSKNMAYSIAGEGRLRAAPTWGRKGESLREISDSFDSSDFDLPARASDGRPPGVLYASEPLRSAGHCHSV
ncbi:hypothetical protein HPB50_006336 [Hyalomma asiaticum]|uniref:Uncharacterized protein n=1 Tax=Hyalomma asiaticum TaxID=266040 RepID=A0ACB7RY76_HYAAI|nr:hypothetical protein HPB50_006336 [Hyalomma asiaticum]